MPTPAQPHAAEQQRDSITPPSTDHGPTADTITTPGRASRAVHECEALKRNGRPCGRYVATIFTPPYAGAAAQWLCPQHKPRKPKAAPDGAPTTAPKPPVSHIHTVADALRLASWAGVQGALGRISPQQGRLVLAACAEFRIAWAKQEQHEAQVTLIEAWDRAQDAEEAKDADALKAARADMRRAFAALGIGTREKDPEPQPAPARSPDGLLRDEDDTP